MTNPMRCSTTARRLAAMSLVLQCACFTSPSPHNAALRDTQRGEAVTLHLINGTARVGELLAVRDSSIVLLMGDRVAEAALADVADLSVNRDAWRSIRLETSAARAQVARVSRFPFGITPSALSALLAESKQQVPDPITTRPR